MWIGLTIDVFHDEEKIPLMQHDQESTKSLLSTIGRHLTPSVNKRYKRTGSFQPVAKQKAEKDTTNIIFDFMGK